MLDYDIESAFKAIEDELLSSMIRNLKHHRAEETKEGFEWTSWQTEQLNALNKYKTRNSKVFKKRFSEINSKIESGIRESKELGSMNEEVAILEAIKKGFKPRRTSDAVQAEFFKLNERKLDALIKATTNDMKKVESAMLRMANDQYRKVIFNAQVYANTGAGTYEQAVDMATKDFLSRGINCVEYKNGARVNIASYAAMAIRTANTRAYLQGEGEKRKEWGISTVIVTKRGHACFKCLKWTGKVLIDDVWSGGKATDGEYPLMSTAIAQGLYHPNCKDGHTTYFPGISEEPEKLTNKSIEKSVEVYKDEQRIHYAQRQVEKYKNLSDNSLDEKNKKRYAILQNKWREELIRAKDRVTGSTQKKVQTFSEKLDAIQNIDVKILLEQSMKRVGFEVSARRASYFSKGKVYLAKKDSLDAIAHELFHEIDSSYCLSQNGFITDSLKADYKKLENLEKIYRKQLVEVLKSKYPEAFFRNQSGELKVYEKYRGISDILHGMTDGRINLGYGHYRRGYWKKPFALEKETFAQYGRMLYNQDENVLKMAEEIFPETNKEIMGRLKRMVK